MAPKGAEPSDALGGVSNTLHQNPKQSSPPPHMSRQVSTRRLSNAPSKNSFRNLGDLKAALGFDTLDRTREWLEGDRFGNHLKELYESWILPHQTRCRQRGLNIKQGPTLKAIQEQVTEGEKGGACRYSDRVIDKEDWSAIYCGNLFIQFPGFFLRSSETQQRHESPPRYHG